MTEKIKRNHPDFVSLCDELGIEYPSTVHHLQKNESGGYDITLWQDVPVISSATERTIVEC